MRVLRRAQGAGAALAGALAAALMVGAAGRQAGLLAGPVALAPALQTGPSSGLIGVLAIEDARAPLPEDLSALVALARSGNVGVQRAAVRALGRLERRDVVTDLLQYLQARDAGVSEEAASSLVLALRGAGEQLGIRWTQLLRLRSSRPRLSSRRCRPPARRPRIGRSAGSRTRRQASFGRPNGTSRRRSRRVRRRESVLFGASNRSRG